MAAENVAAFPRADVRRQRRTAELAERLAANGYDGGVADDRGRLLAAREVAMAIRLPCTKFGKKASWWSITETGDARLDGFVGAHLAIEVMAMLPMQPNLLTNIMRDMVQAGRFGGIELAFCSEIEQLLAA